MTDETFDLPDDGLDAALRRELSSLHVRFDDRRADEMITAATDAQPLGARSWQAPLAAAAAVVVVGGGAALIATHQSGHDTDAGGGPGGCVPGSSAAVPSAVISGPAQPSATRSSAVSPSDTRSLPTPRISARVTRLAAGATPTLQYNDDLPPAPSGSDSGWHTYEPCAPSFTRTSSFTVAPTVTSTTTAAGTPTRTDPPPSASSTRPMLPLRLVLTSDSRNRVTYVGPQIPFGTELVVTGVENVASRGSSTVVLRHGQGPAFLTFSVDANGRYTETGEPSGVFTSAKPLTAAMTCTSPSGCALTLKIFGHFHTT